MNRNIKSLDHLHILLWLLKDISWMMKWREFGMIMILPTIAVAAFVTYRSLKRPSTFIPNLAVLFWISANSTWMCSEFYELNLENYASVLFAFGLFSILFFYGREFLKKGK